MTRTKKRKARPRKSDAEKLVDKLFADLRDRSLLKWLFSKHETRVCSHFESIDLSVQKEIKDTWIAIIAEWSESKESK